MRKISPMKELSATWEDLKKVSIKEVNLLINGFNEKSGNFDTNNSLVYMDTRRRDQNVSINYQIHLF
jgi:hypothetical protein